MRFDGTIIIVDPNTIIGKEHDYTNFPPKIEDFISKKKYMTLYKKGVPFQHFVMPEHEDYPDCRPMLKEDCENDRIMQLIIENINHPVCYFSPTLKAEKDAFKEAQNKFEHIRHNDWSVVCTEEKMRELGFTSYLTEYTWQTKMKGIIYNTDKNTKIGDYISAFGAISVFLLDEVLKLKPDFDISTCIKFDDFHGDIDMKYNENSDTVDIIANGNINFNMVGIENMNHSYNHKMRFDGDIIITDPCYIMNHENDGYDKDRIYWWDYVSKTTVSECIDGNGKKFNRYNMPKPEDYPDCRPKMVSDMDEFSRTTALLRMMEGKPLGNYSPTLQAEMDAYHKAENESLVAYRSDWDKCKCGQDMFVLGLNNFLVNNTKYGDWSCTTYNSDTKEPIGEFCADAGMVAVFQLDEVLKYNPNFDYHINRPWTTTLIKDFHGEVEIRLVDEETVQVIGTGNINFITYQTGL